MMTREEAIEVLENGGWRDLLIPVTTIEGRIEDDKLHEALDLAIAALHPVSREQVEKVWRGEWIKMNAHRGMEQYKCSKCGQEIYVPEFMGEPLYTFCPMCCAAMTDSSVDVILDKFGEINLEQDN